MIKKTLTIVNKLGLHARAAAKFVNLSAKYRSSIEVKIDNKITNGKSIMGIMMLAASKGTKLEITIKGEDEAEMMAKVEELINGKFGESD